MCVSSVVCIMDVSVRRTLRLHIRRLQERLANSDAACRTSSPLVIAIPGGPHCPHDGAITQDACRDSRLKVLLPGEVVSSSIQSGDDVPNSSQMYMLAPLL